MRIVHSYMSRESQRSQRPARMCLPRFCSRFALIDDRVRPRGQGIRRTSDPFPSRAGVARLVASLPPRPFGLLTTPSVRRRRRRHSLPAENQLSLSPDFRV